MKIHRLFAACAAIVVSATGLSQLTEAPFHAYDRKNGDVTLDNVVDISDVILLAKYTVEAAGAFSEAAKENADADHDGLINAADCVYIMKWIAKLVPDEEFFAVPAETTTAVTTETMPETTTTATQYDMSGFAWQWPEVFLQDDSVEITENSYRSHDVAIEITDCISEEDELAYYVCDIYIRDINCLRGAFAKGSYMEPRSGQTDSVTNMAKENNAILAMNADYVEIRDTGVVYRNGVLYRDVRKGDVCTIYKNGVMDLKEKDEFEALTDADKTDIWHTFCFGPILVRDGVAESGIKSSISGENPRSGIGFYEPGHYCFVMVDGRQPGYSMGVTLDEFAQIFAELGCTQAYNLDGGRSAEIVFNGKTYDKPYLGGRYSSDIVYICENPEK